jgi:hypothetical protein
MGYCSKANQIEGLIMIGLSNSFDPLITMNKRSIIKYAAGLILLLVVIEFFGWSVWYQMKHGKKLGMLGEAIYSAATYPNKFIERFSNLPEKIATGKESQLLIQNQHLQSENYKVYSNIVDSGFLLIPCYNRAINQSYVKLFSLQKNAVVHTWTPDIKEFNKINELNDIAARYINNTFEIIHPILTKDTGLILKAENSLLYKLNKDSKIEWYLKGNFHHSIEQDAEGNYWVLYTPLKPDLDTITYPGLQDECIAKVSPKGKLLYSLSVTKTLLDNGYKSLMVGIGLYQKSPLHLNDVQPALYNSKYWQKGDLLISMRNRSTIMLYSQVKKKIVWLQTGPWLNQHDVNFADSLSISVYGNDVMRIDDKRYQLVHKHNNLYVYNFSTNTTTKPYDMAFSNNNIQTERSGRGMILNNKDLFVEETNYGKVYRLNNSTIIWRYMEIIDSNFIGRISWSRYYSHLPL